MPTLYIIRGIPGSGKSTLAEKMCNENPNCKMCESDDYFMFLGEYNFDPTKLKQAHEYCRETAFMFMSEGFDVIVSNTFTQKWEAQPYIDKAKELGYNIEIIICNGNYGSIHNVPEEVIQNMKKRWQDSSDWI